MKTAIALCLTACLASPALSESYTATLVCHGSTKQIVLWQKIETKGECLDSVDDFVDDNSSEAGFLCFPHQWEMKCSKQSESEGKGHAH